MTIDEELFAAVEAGDTHRASWLIEAGANVNAHSSPVSDTHCAIVEFDIAVRVQCRACR